MTERISTSIVTTLPIDLSPLAKGPDSNILISFMSGLDKLVKTAYDWNTTAKRDVLDYDLEPFAPFPHAAWDPVRMAAFEVGTIPQPRERIVAPVSLGLVASAESGTGRISEVQEKAQVLVDAWFPTPTVSKTKKKSTRSAPVK